MSAPVTPPLSDRRRHVLLMALYASQYFGIGFLVYGVMSILRSEGMSLELLATLNSLGVVWALKFLWSPLVDRYSLPLDTGHFRSWILLLQTLMTVTLVGISFLGDLTASFSVLVALAAVFIVCSATQDVAVDGLAVRITPPEDRARVNGIQVAGSFVGNIVGGGLMALLYDAVGWQPAVLTLAALTLLPLALVLGFREPAHERAGTDVSLRHLAAVVRQPGAATWMFAAVPLMWGGLTAGYAVVNPAFIDAGWSVGGTGALLSIFGSVVGVVAGIGAGRLTDRLGRRKALLFCGVVTPLGLLGFTPVALGWAPVPYAVAATALFFVAYTIGSVFVYMINMDYARRESPASDYTVMSSFAMATSFVLGGVATALAGAVGYLAVLLVSVPVFVLGVALTLRHQARFDTAGLNREAAEVPAAPAGEPVRLGA